MNQRIEWWQGDDGRVYWHLVHHNGNIEASGSYSRSYSVRRMARVHYTGLEVVRVKNGAVHQISWARP